MPIADVTCVVPTHRRPGLVQEALASVAAQRLVPREVVVVDDAGDDGLDDVVGRLFESTPVSASVIHAVSAQPGASASRNLGVSCASGVFLAFLDDDDAWPDNYLEAMVDRLERTEADFAVAPLRLWNGADMLPGRTMSEGMTATDVVVRNPGFTGSNFVVRRDVLETIGGFDSSLPVSNDKDVLVRLLAGGSSYAVCTATYALQRRHEGEQLTAWNERRVNGLKAYMVKHDDLLSWDGRLRINAQIAAIRRRTSTSRAARVGYTMQQLAGVRASSLRERRVRRELGGSKLWL